MRAVEVTDFSVCRSCQVTFPTEQGWTGTHCSEECHALRELPPKSGITIVSFDSSDDAGNHETDLCPGDHHCVYPTSDADLTLLPEDWQDEARYILRHVRRHGSPLQGGCCCGSRHRALTRAEVYSLRLGGFTVTVVTDGDRGCGGSNRGGSSYDFDSDYYDSRDSYGDMDDYDWRDSYRHADDDADDDHNDPRVAEAMKSRYLAGDRVDYGYDTPSYPPEDHEYYYDSVYSEDLPEEFHTGPTAEAEALEDLGFFGSPDEPEFIVLDDVTKLPHDPTPATYEPLDPLPEIVGVFQIQSMLGWFRLSHRFGGKIRDRYVWEYLRDYMDFSSMEHAQTYARALMRNLDSSWQR